MSRTLVTGVLVSAALAVGIAIGFLVGGGREESGHSALDPLGGSSTGTPSAAQARAHDPGAPPPIATTGYAESAGSIEAEIPEAAPDALSPTGAVVPGGRITGSVRTGRGAPIAGAVVRALRNPTPEDRDRDEQIERKPGDAPPTTDLRERVRRYIEREQRSLQSLRETKSGPDGSFVLDGVASEGTYQVEAFATGYEVTEAPGSQSTNEATAGARLDFVGSRVQTIRVDVLAPDGTKPPRARLRLQESNDEEDENVEWDSGKLWTPAEPEIRLTSGLHRIRAVGGEQGELRSELVSLFVDPDRAPEPLTLKLEGATGIRGRIQVPEDLLQASLGVRLMAFEGGSPPDDDKLRNEGRGWWIAPAQRHRYAFVGIPAGDYRLAVQLGQRRFLHSETVTIKAGVTLVRDIELTAPDDAGLIVRVLGPDGAPLTAVELDVRAAGGDEHEFTGRNRRRPKRDSEEEGEWEVRPRKDRSFLVLRHGPAPEVPTAIVVESRSFGRKIVAMPASLSGSLEIGFEAPATLEVVVSGSEKLIASQRHQMLLRVSPTSELAAKASQEGWGPGAHSAWLRSPRASFGPLQPGSYEVALSMNGNWRTVETAPSVRVTLVPGPNRATLELPALHKLVVQMPDAGPEQWLSLQTTSEQREWVAGARVDSEGLATFENLFAGDYRLVFWSGSGERAMPVHVPTPGVLRFVPPIARALRVRKLPEASYIAELGLRQGDTIIGINGAEFDGEKPASDIVNGLMLARNENSLLVQRGTERIELKVDATRFRDEGTAGFFEPLQH